MEKHGVSHTEDSPEYQLAGLPLVQRLVCLPPSDSLSVHKRKALWAVRTPGVGSLGACGRED